MSKYPLLEYVQTTADANGRAVASTGPKKFGESWDVTLISTNTNSTAESQLRVYRGVESETSQILSTYSGNSDTAGGGSNIKVPAQDKLVFVWSGCDAGSTCNARIEGDLISGRR
jgi:hypothetical protein